MRARVNGTRPAVRNPEQFRACPAPDANASRNTECSRPTGRLRAMCLALIFGKERERGSGCDDGGDFTMAEKDNKGSMTVAEAGRKGGETVRNERGREFYEAIGRKGGATVKAERGRSFYEEIGRKGGETVKAERGAKFYEEIGKKGGDRVKATRGPNFYEEIGRKGGQKVKKLIEEGKRAARAALEAQAKPSEGVDTGDTKPD